MTPLSIKTSPHGSSVSRSPSPSDVTSYNSPKINSKLDLTTPVAALPIHTPCTDSALDLSRPTVRQRHRFAPYPLMAPRLPRFFAPPPLPSAAFPGLLMPAPFSLGHNVLCAERFTHDVTRCNNNMAAPHAGALQIRPDVMTHARESLQETGARVLFSVVHWLRCVGGFNSLPLKSQVSDPTFNKQ